jgi:predicted N-acetyltransferase YhbS
MASDVIDLADVPEYVPLLAGWFMQEWGAYYRDRAPGDAEETFRKRLSADTIPLALVALERGKPVGTVSLTDVSVPTHMHLGPWIGGLYVVPESRHHGLGMELVSAALRRARALGVARIYIAVGSAVDRYREHGWEILESADVNGQEVTVLSFDLAAARTAPKAGDAAHTGMP